MSVMISSLRRSKEARTTSAIATENNLLMIVVIVSKRKRSKSWSIDMIDFEWHNEGIYQSEVLRSKVNLEALI